MKKIRILQTVRMMTKKGVTTTNSMLAPKIVVKILQSALVGLAMTNLDEFAEKLSTLTWKRFLSAKDRDSRYVPNETPEIQLRRTK